MFKLNSTHAVSQENQLHGFGYYNYFPNKTMLQSVCCCTNQSGRCLQNVKFLMVCFATTLVKSTYIVRT